MATLHRKESLTLRLFCILLLSLCGTYKLSAKIQFEKDILPLLEQSCLKCHGGEKVNGEVDFSKIKNQTHADSHYELWETVVEVISAGEMPPEESPQLKEDEKALLLNWYKQQLNANVKAKPGTFKARRLSGPEYRNTLRSLFGFDLKLAVAKAQQTAAGEESLVLKLLPKDPPGDSGFINDTHGAPLSSVILEQYAFFTDATLEKLFAPKQRPDTPVTLDDQVEAMLDVIAMALWTDSTRCISYMLGNSNSRLIFDFLGINKQHHYLSHFFRNFSRSNIDSLLKISLWHMEKFDSLLTRLKSYKDGRGSLLDNSVVLFGSGMGHSDNHTAQRIPIILAGKGGGMLKTGRYLRYSKNQELGRLHMALMQKFGIDQKSYANSSTPLPGLDGSPFDEFQERPFESWVNKAPGTITAQGRLRMSDNLDEAKVFYIDIEGKPSVRIEISFGDFHSFNVAYHVGTPIKLSGNSSEKNGQLVINKITGITSLFGNSKPGKANG